MRAGYMPCVIAARSMDRRDCEKIGIIVHDNVYLYRGKSKQGKDC